MRENPLISLRFPDLDDLQLRSVPPPVTVIVVLEEQKNEAAENVEDEGKPCEAEPCDAEPTSRNDGFDEKPDISDALMDESQEDTKIARQDLNKSTLDLSLG
ncbi:Formyl transferase [Hibiscus syriacus]|uniref:Formyl transferase n=1 Tax=Hibiscus syriacus TaxID=106335 RepID=A0A6A2YUJ8_HIBSY|nr:Formyl transferase [Hibiscus syriacus]